MTMLISDTYRDLNRKLHADSASYGANGHRWARTVRHLYRLTGSKSLLDYGCGKQTLSTALRGIPVTSYDPAIPAMSSRPQPHDFVVCGDVLEHIEPDLLDEVLLDLHRVTRKAGLFVVSTRPSTKTLADGRNAHLIVKPAEWWGLRLNWHFHIVARRNYWRTAECAFVVSPAEDTSILAKVASRIVLL